MTITKFTLFALIISVVANGFLFAEYQDNKALINAQKTEIGKLKSQLTKDNNEIKFVWEGLEKDIPEDGIQELQLTTNENTVYLNPVDE